MIPRRLPRSGGARPMVVGGVLAASYLAVAVAVFCAGLLPGTPILDDGTGPPPPYRWTMPPPALARGNHVPSASTGAIALTGAGSAGSVSSPDGQVQLLLNANSAPLMAGQSSVSITMAPMDPATVGPAPAGFGFDANAYSISAAYRPSGQPITRISAVVVLRYATSADRVVQWDGSTWQSLASTQAGSSLLFASVSRLGSFSTAVRGAPAPPAGSSPLIPVAEIISAFAVVVALGLLVVVRSSRGRALRP